MFKKYSRPFFALFGLFTLGFTSLYLTSTPAYAAVFTVTNTNDSGAGSFRAALSSANSAGGADSINFNISGGGVHTINATGQYTATSPVTIDGTSQPGYSGTPLVKLNGTNAGDVPGIWVTGGGSNSTIKGLAIVRFQNNGIKLEGSGNTISANYIGIDTDGTTALGNGYGGSGGRGSLGITSANNTIGGSNVADRNIISGNSGNGIDIVGSGATGNTIKGNFIGTNASGTGAVPNSADGILVSLAPFNTIGGATGTTPGGACTGDCNLFAGNGYNGIGVWNEHAAGPITAKNTSIIGNFVGLNASGTSAIANFNIGIELYNSPDNSIGDGASAGRNVSSGNGGAGVFITGSPSTGNTVKGNYIGTNSAGTAAVANAKMGVGIGYSPGLEPAKSNTVGGANNVTPGGACTGDCNVISGNAANGILISGFGDGVLGGANTIRGNYIGTNASGTGVLANTGDGIGILDAANNTIGGSNTDPDAPTSARNVISGNTDNGIIVAGNGTTGNRIEGNYLGLMSNGGSLGNAGNGILLASGVDTAMLGNYISFNVKLGIDLGQNHITQNDANDPDGGVNRLQNFPNLYAARNSGGVTKIGGHFNGTPNTDLRLEFFQSDGCNAGYPNNFGEGQKFIGSADYSTDVHGNVAFGFQPPTQVPGGKYITATATKKINGTPAETSEFSQCILVNVAKPALTNGATWYLKYDLTAGPADKTFGYGFPAELLMCAWDPNQIGVKLPVIVSGGTWYMRASYTTGTADLSFSYGASNGKPICGDWNGDGVETVGMFTGGNWALRNTNSSGAADITFAYGGAGPQPVVGDWDGNGTDTIGVVQSGNNVGWNLRNSNSSGAPDHSFNYGGAGAQFVIGDWDGNASDSIGVVYDGSRWELRNNNSSGAPNVNFQYGFSGVKPLIW